MCRQQPRLCPRSAAPRLLIPATRSSVSLSCLPVSPDRAIDVGGKFDKEVQQRPIAGLPQHGAAALGESVARMRLPRRRQEPPAKRTAIQRELRTQLLLRHIVRKKVAHDRVPRPRPETAASALVVTRFIF